MKSSVWNIAIFASVSALVLLQIFSETKCLSEVLVVKDNDERPQRNIKPPRIIDSTFARSTRVADNVRKYVCELEPRLSKRRSTSRAGNIATAVVFQSNSAHQLQNFVAHHAQVVGTEHIVIIDHQSDRQLADPYTASLLEEYHKLGIDIWRCDGSFDRKSNMWTDIIHQYTHSSEFVFPLDVDELLAVKTNMTTENPMHDKTANNELLTWNAADFVNVLNALPDSEKPFKIESGLALPIDCNHYKWDAWFNTYSNGTKAPAYPTTPVLEYNKDPMSKVKYVARRRIARSFCLDKAFMRGKDFNRTDTGNHIGATHKYSMEQVVEGCEKKNLTVHLQGGGETTEQHRLHAKDQSSALYMIHMQQINFEEFLLHQLRGASDRKFNRFDGPVDCTKAVVSVHYCKGWNDLMETEFAPKKMRKMYEDKLCGPLIAFHSAMPIEHIFSNHHSIN